MKTNSTRWYLTMLTLATLARLGSWCSWAATPRIDPDTQARELAVYRSALDNATTFAKGENLSSVEQELGRLNRSRPSSALWNIEMAQRLLQVVERVARSGGGRAAGITAQRALELLAQVDDKTTDPNQRSRARQLAGLIHERWLGNNQAALASYQAAAALAPDNSSARRAAKRLELNTPKG